MSYALLSDGEYGVPIELTLGVENCSPCGEKKWTASRLSIMYRRKAVLCHREDHEDRSIRIRDGDG